MRTAYLDLEDTVIEPALDGFANANLINIAKVRAMLDVFNPQELHIFSFAIYNDFDIRSFDEHLKPRLENALGRKIDRIVSLAQMGGMYPIHQPNHLVMGLGKEAVFRDWIDYALKRKGTHLLIDDSIETFILYGRECVSFFQNVDSDIIFYEQDTKETDDGKFSGCISCNG